jgi:hypothetical protein
MRWIGELETFPLWSFDASLSHAWPPTLYRSRDWPIHFTSKQAQTGRPLWSIGRFLTWFSTRGWSFPPGVNLAPRVEFWYKGIMLPDWMLLL